MADAATTSPLDEQSEKLFTLMDADGDGQLTETEGHIVADAFGCNPATFWSLLEKYDADLDGTISRTEFAAALQGRVLQAFFPRHAKKDFGAVIAAAIEALESGSAGAHHEPGRWQRGGEEAEEAPAEEEVPVGLPA